MDPLGFSMVHPFEQRNLQWGLMHMRRFQQRLQTLVHLSLPRARKLHAGPPS